MSVGRRTSGEYESSGIQSKNNIFSPKYALRAGRVYLPPDNIIHESFSLKPGTADGKRIFFLLMEGWLKLHRSILDSWQFQDETVLKVWVWLMCKASIGPRFVKLKIGKGYRVIEVKRGQMIFGRHAAETALKVDGSTIYRIIQRMAEDGSIIIESNNQYSMITLVHFEEHQKSTQDEEIELEEIGTTNEQPLSNQRTTNEQQTNNERTSNEHKQEGIRIVEGNNGKEGKEVSTPASAAVPALPTIESENQPAEAEKPPPSAAPPNNQTEQGEGMNFPFSLQLWNEHARFTVDIQIGATGLEKRIGCAVFVCKPNEGKSELPSIVQNLLQNTVNKWLQSISKLAPKDMFTSTNFVEWDAAAQWDNQQTFPGMSSGGFNFLIQFQEAQKIIWDGRVQFAEPNTNHPPSLTLTGYYRENPAESMLKEICKSFAPTAINAKRTTLKAGKDKSQLHLFSESPIFDKLIFSQSLWGTQYQEANVDYYHEAISTWADSKKEKKVDWLAAAKGWMLRDMKKGEFIKNDFKAPQDGTRTKQQSSSEQSRKATTAQAAVNIINSRNERRTGGGAPVGSGEAV